MEANRPGKGRECVDCGITIESKRGGPLRCADCKVKRKQEHDRRDRPERIVPTDRQLICQDCGKPFSANRSDAKRCMPCRVRQTSHRPGRSRPPGRPHDIQRVCKGCSQIFMGNLRTTFCDACRHARHSAATRRSQAKTDTSLCPGCGGLKRRNSKSCRSCNSPANLPEKVRRGAEHPNWKGGRYLDSAGYVMVSTGPNRREREHRFLWKQAYGPIPTGHVIHHVNGDKTDNRLENLVCLARSDHQKAHAAVDGERSHAIQGLEASIRQMQTRIRELESQ